MNFCTNIPKMWERGGEEEKEEEAEEEEKNVTLLLSPPSKKFLNDYSKTENCVEAPTKS